ncbi:MAG TPA: ATP-binding cassette domain-containing protein [Streptosporangiaceae bacterium]|nr:ATP-binding cassette domain-containing protein [Streptosporangiaceae bacterium]
MIEFDQVGVRYADSDGPVLGNITLHIDEGELCLVVGSTGSGKSTLLGAINGLVPHFTGGTLAGRVLVGGRDTARFPPRELADVVGLVGQDPLAGFVTDTVEEELAYTMEQLAIDPAAMRARCEETLDLLGIADLRRRALRTLSGGQQQRVAIGAALTAHPRVLVLDEPTSALDPTSAEDVLAAITRLVHDLGITVVLAEHRLERVLPYADKIIYLPGDGTATAGVPAEVMRTASVSPPVVELGRLAGWDPLPLSVRDARRRAPELRGRLPGTPPVDARGATPHPGNQKASPFLAATGATPQRGNQKASRALTASGIVVRYGPLVAVRGVDLALDPGEITALMGRNGSGKSSLLWAIQGSGRRDDGTVSAGPDRADPAKLSPAAARRLVGLVPQTPADLLYLDSVKAELAQADIDGGSRGSGPLHPPPSHPDQHRADRRSRPGSASGILESIAPGIPANTHPRDLSTGQQLALVLAIQLAAAPAVIGLDEPTRGLDYQAKAALTSTLSKLAADGHAIVVATHDVEFATRTCDRVVVMAEGEIVTDGPAASVLTASPTFAPQIAKILAPLPYLTAAQIAAALEPAALEPAALEPAALEPAALDPAAPGASP